MVGNIFVSSNQQGKLGVIVARRGYQETAENGDRFLVLLNGRRYDGMPGTPSIECIIRTLRHASGSGPGARSRGDDQNDQTSWTSCGIRRRAISPSSHGGSAFR